MRRSIAFGLAVWLVTASLFALPSPPALAQDGATLGDAPYLADGMVIAASGDDIVQAAAVPAVDISSRSASAAFYFGYYTGQPAIGWTGSQASCNPGTTTAAFKAAVIDRVAFYRAMAGVPSSIGLAATSSTSNQQAALMFSRNNQLSHSPSSSWACYTSSGAQGAANSNIALGAFGVGAIDAYMKDAGSNNAAAGHRRWILLPADPVVRNRRCSRWRWLCLRELPLGLGFECQRSTPQHPRRVRRLAATRVCSLSGRLSALVVLLSWCQLRWRVCDRDTQRRKCPRRSRLLDCQRLWREHDRLPPEWHGRFRFLGEPRNRPNLHGPHLGSR